MGLLVSSYIQYNREIDRLTTSFVEMMEHLITIEDINTALVYVEHYDHTHGVNLIYYDKSGAILYQSDSISSNPEIIHLYDSSQELIGSMSIDYQSSVLGRELSYGFIAFNLFSLALFIVGLIVMNQYLNRQYLTFKEDMNHIGKEHQAFRFEDIDLINSKYLKALSAEKEIKSLQEHYVKVLAHDVKTPLTVMKAYLEGISTKRLEFSDEINRDLLSEIDNIEKIIPQLMISNIEDIVKTQNIAPPIRKHIEKLKETFKSKDIEITQNIEDLEVHISTADILRIVEHLMFNAFYYSDKNTSIHIQLSRTEKKLTITDHGIGMSQETIDLVQQGSYRSKDAMIYHQTGSGVGLQIVKEIVKKTNATLSIQSVFGTGTSVSVQFK
ncbi:MAG: sensor histidine kinase [Candidatus Izemoplasmataceae bacterium]